MGNDLTWVSSYRARATLSASQMAFHAVTGYLLYVGMRREHDAEVFPP